MICGQYDSLWKWQYGPNGRKTKRVLGHFDTAMNFARKHKLGITGIQHIRNQPWETWSGEILLTPSKGEWRDVPVEEEE